MNWLEDNYEDLEDDVQQRYDDLKEKINENNKG
jgi:hypothetical protein